MADRDRRLNENMTLELKLSAESEQVRAEDAQVAREEETVDSQFSRLSFEVERLKQVVAEAQAALAVQEKARDHVAKELESVKSRRRLTTGSVAEKDRALKDSPYYFERNLLERDLREQNFSSLWLPLPIALSVSVGDERYYDALPHVKAGLEAVRRAGDASLTWRCERELERVEGWMYRLEELAYEDSSDMPPPPSLRFLLEREERAKQIQAKEAELKRLLKQQRTVLDRMDAYLDRAFFEDAGSLRGEAKLRERELEAKRLSGVAATVDQELQLLRQEEEASKADSAKRQQRGREEARIQRAVERAKLKAKIGSFSLLKFL
ncbi:uncharacterized protein LOC109846940 [Asparagus officinalis]|uniref:uncharacterized protein LOC109846940 n=1 Tax=Asparagus officinalis TaxID=4686 RepID=UPI00098E2C57|nr:uncharacterized protein LOC109846940 [Asparagus officinalis]